MSVLTEYLNRFNLPNYVGEVYVVSPTQTPFLSMIGGLNQGKVSQSIQFPLGVEYDLPNPTQNDVKSEDEARTGNTRIGFAPIQTNNVAQVHQEIIEITYASLSDYQLQGIAFPNADMPTNKLVQQTNLALIKVARDIEYSFLNGSFHLATSKTDKNKTRGIKEAAVSAGNVVNANNNALSEALLKQLLRQVFRNGGQFQNPVIFANAEVKEMISDIWGYAPQDRNIGGLNIKQLETDYGNIGVVLNPFAETSTLYLIDVAFCSPVWVPVPDKGLLFREPLSKDGASEKYQLYGQVGLDYGSGKFHGVITNIAV